MAITISDTTPRVQYTATSGQTTFAVNFEFFVNADLKVYNGTTLLTYDASPSSASEYSVSGAGQTGGGSITLGGGATVGDKITIYRDMAIARSTDFPTSGAFQVSSLNEELDKLTAMIQQVKNDLKYSPKAASTTSNTYDLTFPNLVANKFLTVNTGGTALEFTQDVTNVNTVAGIATDITAVSNISANVTTVAGVHANVTTVANNIASVNTVAADITKVVAVANDLAEAVSEVETVADDLNETTSTDHTYAFHRLVPKATEVTTVSGSISGVNTVAGAISNVNTVAGISGNVTTVAGISANVTTVANDGTDIGTVAGSISNVNTTAGSIANVNSTAGSIANVNTVATNLTAINNASTYLNNFLSLYLGQASSDPTVDGLGNALTEGDKYFNTVSKQIRVWNGQVWQGIAENTVEVARFANATFSSVYTASAGSNSIDLGGLAVTGAVFSNESIVSTRIALLKGSGTFNLGGI